MKIFISWSGPASRAAAVALQQAIRDVFTAADPWISTDIKTGQQWFDEIMAALEDTRFAVVCLTARNLHAPWILFESGVVSGHFGSATKVAPLLLDVPGAELELPLNWFQAAIFDKTGVKQLFESINASLGTPLAKKALSAAFNDVWGDLEAAVRNALQLDRPRFDVFLSAPMASFTSDAEYQPFRENVMKVFGALKNQCGLSVYCALENIASIKDFETMGVSGREDIDNLEQSANFVMVYPERMASSSLFEAGYALAKGIPCRLFVRDQNDIKNQLPFLMQKLPEVFSNVSIIDQKEWKTYDDIGVRLEQNKAVWFGTRLQAKKN